MMKLFFKKVSTLPLPLWARSAEKKLGKQWPKATPFPAGGAQSAPRTARCRSYSLREPSIRPREVSPRPFTPAWHGSTWAAWAACQTPSLRKFGVIPEEGTPSGTAPFPQKKTAPGLLCVKTLAKPRRFLYNIPRRFRDLPTQSQSARNHRGFPGKEGRNTNGTQVFPKRHRNHEAGGY